MKLKLSLCLTLFAALFLLSACGEKKETLNVFNWGDYIAPEVLEMFEEETGIKVNYETFDSNEAMYAKYKSGGIDYDVLVPSDYMIEKMISEDELLPLNYDNIPNATYLDENFKNIAFDPTNTYSMPYMWGTVGIVYNTDKIDVEVDSWDILWDEQYKGQILMQNSVRDAFAVALKKLGYSLNATDEGQLREAMALLKEQKDLVQAYVIDQVKDKMIGGEASLAVIYSGEYAIIAEDNPQMSYVVPKEGSNLWTDAFVIPKSSKNKEAAEKFINFMSSPEISFLNADYIGYATPNTGARELLDEEILNDPAMYPTQAIIDNCEVFVDLGPTVTQLYNDLWNEVLAQ